MSVRTTSASRSPRSAIPRSAPAPTDQRPRRGHHSGRSCGPAAPRRPALALALVLIVATATACAGDGSDERTPNSKPSASSSNRAVASPSTTTTTTATTTPEAGAKAAYLEIMAAYYRRLEHPDPNDPTIARYHTGPSLRAVMTRTQVLASAGQADRMAGHGAPIPKVDSIQVRGAIAVIKSCIVDDVRVVEISTGRAVDAKVISQGLEVVLVSVSGHWKMRDNRLIRRAAGLRGCDS